MGGWTCQFIFDGHWVRWPGREKIRINQQRWSHSTTHSNEGKLL